MINRNELLKIGQLYKTHGLKGELSFSMTHPDLFEENEYEYLFIEMEGIFVPFYISEYRFKSNESGYITFDDVNDEKQAKEFVNKELYVRAPEDDETTPLQGFFMFIGYEVIDKHLGSVGKIRDIDDTTINTLFVLNNGGEEVLIPVSDEFFTEIDHEGKIIYADLPEGLIE